MGGVKKWNSKCCERGCLKLEDTGLRSKDGKIRQPKEVEGLFWKKEADVRYR